MHRKRGLILIAVLALALFMAACGGAAAPESPSPPTQTPIPPANTPSPPTDTPIPATDTPPPTAESMTPAQQKAAALWQSLHEADYQGKWSLVPGKGELYAGQGPHGMLLTTYLNEAAFNTMESKPGQFPAGAVLVKENYKPDKTLAAITVMVKEAGFDPDHNDWFFAKFGPDGSVQAAGSPAGCVSCHGAVRSNDYVYTFPVAPIPPEGPPPPVSEMGKQRDSMAPSAETGEQAGMGDESPPEKPDMARVVALVQKGGCAECHTIAPIEGALGDLGPDWCEPAREYQEGAVSLAFLRESILNPNAQVDEKFPANIMPQNFGQRFTAEEIETLVAFIATLDCS